MAENLGRISPKEGKSPTNVTEWKNYFSSPENDFKTYENINSLREEVENPNGWIKTKELAKQEIKDVPEDIIPKIFARFEPYLENLPGGHSKNHAYRDLISSVLISQDPWVRNLDDVEKFIGILGGTFHDIGNSVSGRYEETKNFSGHAERGAYLFGELTKDLLPQNLLKLTKFAIAAHTNYQKDTPIPPKMINGEEKVVIKKPYNQTLDEQNNKVGVWLTQWADRLDAQGVQFFVRNAVASAEPKEDYSSSVGFSPKKENEEEDFKHHFNPVLRTENFTGGMDILEHMTLFKDSALNKTIYSQHDTSYFTNELVRPNAIEQEKFIQKVLEETPVMTDEQMDKNFETFYAMCRKVDAGSNIETVIELLKKKLPYLSKEQRSHWANGFAVLPELYNQMLLRTEKKLYEANNNRNQSGIFKEAGKLALTKLEDLKRS